MEYSIREMCSLCLAMEIYWDGIFTQNDDEIREELEKFRVASYEIEENYYGSIDYVPYFWYALYAKHLFLRYFKSQFEVDIKKTEKKKKKKEKN